MIFPCQIIYSHAFTENIAQLACSGTQLHCSIWGQDLSAVKALICFAMAEPLNSQDRSSNSPYCLPCSSCTCNVSLENLVLDKLIIL